MRHSRLLVRLACAAILAAGLAAPALAQEGGAPTRVGQNVQVSPIAGVVVTFDNVVVAGVTFATRTALEVGQRNTPCGNTIPSFAALPAGDSRFVVFRIETTAGFTDSVEVFISHPDGNARIFRADCPSTGSGFEDITTLAIPGDPRSRIPTFSEFVVVTDTRPNADVIQIKLGELKATLNTGSQAALALDDMTLKTLRTMVRRIIEDVGAGNNPRAIEDTNTLKAFVRAQSGETIPNIDSARGGNVAGTLTSQASTLLFSLSVGF